MCADVYMNGRQRCGLPAPILAVKQRVNFMNSELEEKHILCVDVLVTILLQGETTVPTYFAFLSLPAVQE
jgi:hypothetical protein